MPRNLNGFGYGLAIVHAPSLSDAHLIRNLFKNLNDRGAVAQTMNNHIKMPHRILGPHIEVIAAWFGSMLAVTAGIDDLSNVAIWDKSQLRLWCILGSLGGAFLTVAILPSHEHTGNYARRLALKFVSSSIAGLIFTPIVIRWRGWPVDSDVVLAVSAFVALISVSTISALYPVWLKWVTNRVRRQPYQQEQAEQSETSE